MDVYGLYALSAPHEVRYIGKTRLDPVKRMRQHVKYADRKRTIKDKWIISMRGQVGVRVIGSYDDAAIDFYECMWIAALREAGHRLTNGTIGGTGGATTRGIDHRSQEGRRASATGAASAHRRGQTPAQKAANARRGRPGHKQSAETIAKRAASLRGKKRSPLSDEQKAKLRAAMVGRKYVSKGGVRKRPNGV